MQALKPLEAASGTRLLASSCTSNKQPAGPLMHSCAKALQTLRPVGQHPVVWRAGCKAGSACSSPETEPRQCSDATLSTACCTASDIAMSPNRRATLIPEKLLTCTVLLFTQQAQITKATSVSKGMQSSRSGSFCLGRLLVKAISAQYTSFWKLYTTRHSHMPSMRLAVQLLINNTPKTHRRCA
jgi:hypothetical protein